MTWKKKKKLALSNESHFKLCSNCLYWTVSSSLYLKNWILTWKFLQNLIDVNNITQGISNCVVLIFLFVSFHFKIVFIEVVRKQTLNFFTKSAFTENGICRACIWKWLHRAVTFKYVFKSKLANLLFLKYIAF